MFASNNTRRSIARPLGNPLAQVIGFGPASIGIIVAADRLGLLDSLLQQGVIFIDRRIPGTWDCLGYRIRANTAASGFISGIREDGIFAPILESDVGRSLRNNRSERVSLTLVCEFLELMASRVRKVVRSYPLSNVLEGKSVDRLYKTERNTFVTYGQQSLQIAESKFAVVALGATERPCNGFNPIAHKQCPWILSGMLLEGKKDDLIEAIINRGENITILGGSHSAYSSAEYLLRRFGGELRAGQISVLRKHPVRLYADARKLYVAVRQGREHRVRTLEYAHFDETTFPKSGAVIQATGYDPRVVRVYDPSGLEYRLDVKARNVGLSEYREIRTYLGEEIKGVYGLGLGYVMPEISSKTGRVDYPSAIKYFHGHSAEVIVRGILGA